MADEPPAPAPNQPESPEPPARPEARREIFTSKRLQVLGLVVAVVGVAAALGVFAHHSGRPAEPHSISSAGDLSTYTASQPFWQGTPSIFKSSLDRAISDNQSGTDTRLILATDSTGEPLAYSVPEVLSGGAQLAGLPILVVGRIKSEIASPADANTGENENFAIVNPDDVELVGPRGRGLIYGLIDRSVAGNLTGQVVYLPAVVAAVGRMTGNQATAYIVGLEGPDSPKNYGTSGNDTVRSLGHAFGQ